MQSFIRTDFGKYDFFDNFYHSAPAIWISLSKTVFESSELFSIQVYV